MKKNFRSLLSLSKNALVTQWRRVAGGSNLNRWSNLESYDLTWDKRTKLIAELINPGEKVIEFGAGRMTLKKLLPADCVYIPSDITDRGNNTLVCDLNRRPLPDFPQVDCAVFGGVLEYVNEPASIIKKLKGSTKRIICSYVCSSSKSFSGMFKRRATQWVNDFTHAQLVKLFEDNGFRSTMSKQFEEHQYIFVFANMDR